jgi:hypothetical protein
MEPNLAILHDISGSIGWLGEFAIGILESLFLMYSLFSD